MCIGRENIMLVVTEVNSFSVGGGGEGREGAYKS